jgi:hypothetical protein
MHHRERAARRPQGRGGKGAGFGDRGKAVLEDIAVLTVGQVVLKDPGINARTWPFIGDRARPTRRSRHRQRRPRRCRRDAGAIRSMHL